MNGNGWKEEDYPEMKWIEDLGLEKAKEIILWQREQIAEKQRKIEERRRIIHEYEKKLQEHRTGLKDSFVR